MISKNESINTTKQIEKETEEKYIKCPYCNKNIKESSLICPHCFKKINEEENKENLKNIIKSKGISKLLDKEFYNKLINLIEKEEITEEELNTTIDNYLLKKEPNF